MGLLSGAFGGPFGFLRSNRWTAFGETRKSNKLLKDEWHAFHFIGPGGAKSTLIRKTSWR
jgi:hypothetical protein